MTHHGGFGMKDKAKEIRDMVMDRVQTATKQLHGVEDEMQKLVKTVQERLTATPADGLKRIDDLLKAVAVTDFLEKLKAIEVVNKGGAIRADLLDRFGLVTRDEIDALTARVKKLEGKKPAVTKTQFSKLEKAVAALTKPAPAKKAPAAKPAPAKKAPAKKAPAKKVAKK
jgi:heparin binding hemagglutinin HbhA